MNTALITAFVLTLTAGDQYSLTEALADRERLLRDTNTALTRRDFSTHVQSAQALLDNDLRHFGADSLQVAQSRVQLGTALYLANRPVAAVRELTLAIDELEKFQGIFHADLVAPLGYLGLSLQLLQRHESAGDALVRARQITHRQLGLLNQKQIPLVYSTADAFESQGELWQAEQLQYAVYELHEHNFGGTSPATVGALNRLALWLTDARRYRPALSLYRRGLIDLQDAQGNDTPDMVPLLEGMARTFLFQRMQPGRALNLLLRVAELTDAQPDHFAPYDRFVARVQLGDALMLFSHERDALEHYFLAWDLAAADESLQPWSDEMFTRRTLVAGLFEEIDRAPGLDDTWFRFRFDLRADGRPSMVRLVDTNASASVASSSINLFRSVRFRPLIVEGEPKPRLGQEILLSFRGRG